MNPDTEQDPPTDIPDRQTILQLLKQEIKTNLPDSKIIIKRTNQYTDYTIEIWDTTHHTNNPQEIITNIKTTKKATITLEENTLTIHQHKPKTGIHHWIDLDLTDPNQFNIPNLIQTIKNIT